MCLGQCPAVPGQTTDGVPPGQCRTAPWPGSSTRQHSSTAHQHRHRCSILYIGFHNTILLNMSLFTLNWDACPPNQWVLWLAKYQIVYRCLLMSQLENSAQWPSWPTLRNSVLVPVTHNGIECWDCRGRVTKEKSSPRRKSVSVWLRSVSRPPVCTLRQWCAVLAIVRHDL